MHPLAQQRCQFGAGARADLLQPRALGAEHDRLLAVAADEDLLVDLDLAVGAFEIAFGLDRTGIGQLGMELEVDLLARHLGRQHPVGSVRNLVLGEVPVALRHPGGEPALELGDTVAGGRRDEHDRLGRQPFLQAGGEFEQLLLGRGIDLVEQDELRLGPCRDRVDQRLDAARQPRPGVDHEHDQVGIARALPRGCDHRAIEPATRIEDAGRIDQQQLCLAFDRDPHQPHPRRLRLGADDRDLLADQRVDQRRLARIGGADHRHEAAAFRHFNCPNNVRAASVSASCFDEPVPSASARPGIATSTVKVGAWCGPARLPSV